MRVYETMLLIDGRLDSPQIDAAVDRFVSLVTTNGGEVQETDRWGRRRLAYDIEDIQEGYYVVLTYQLPPEGRRPIEEALPFVDGLVRSKTVSPANRTRKVRS